MIYQFESEEIKNCEDCPCCDGISGCRLGVSEESFSDIPVDCPLVAISKTETTSCEWCNGKEYIIDSRDYTCLGITGNKLAAWGEGEATGYINYCPNCGRRLEGTI